jgi:hypothetical protein
MTENRKSKIPVQPAQARPQWQTNLPTQKLDLPFTNSQGTAGPEILEYLAWNSDFDL